MRGFSLLEVIVAIAVAVLMLTALLSLEIRSTTLAAKTNISFESLPLAIEKIETVSKQQDFTGLSREKVGKFDVETRSMDSTGEIPFYRTKVEVFYNGESCSDISLYKFKL